MAHRDVLVLFDVDGTLTVPRQRATPEMLAALADLRKNYTVGIVGGSDLSKQKEQLSDDVLSLFDYVFSENGMHAFKAGAEIHRQNLKKYLGDERMAFFLRNTLRFLSELEIPVMRGTFIELRNGMFNVSPIGRNCSQDERDAFEHYDQQHQVRAKLIARMQATFTEAAGFPKLKYSIGGQISFDVFPEGWDKTYSLQFVKDQFKEIHFFGDKTSLGGNDYEIYTHKDVKGHSVKTFNETIEIIGGAEFPRQ
jgi:phosphomannomutase